MSQSPYKAILHCLHGLKGGDVVKKLRKPAPTPTKASNAPSMEERPFTMTVKDVAQALGLSVSKTYQLVHTDGFPRLVVGSRVIVPRAKFLEWIDVNTIHTN